MNKVLSVFVALVMGVAPLLAQQTIFFDSFENGSFDSRYWVPIPGSVDGVVGIEQNATPDGFYRVRMGKSRDGADNINELRLFLNLSDYKDIRLQFWFSHLSDDTGPSDGIFFSDDNGIHFQKVYQFRPGDWQSGFWGMLPPLDVASLARDKGLKLTQSFVISFRQQGVGDFSSFGGRDGFFLDAIHVYDPQIQYAQPPFTDDFEGLQPKLGRSWMWNYPSYPLPGTSPESLIKLEGITDILEVQTTPSGFNAVVMGRRDGANENSDIVNALDLHLDLSENGNFELEFLTASAIDQLQAEDYIFLSNNGGRTFKRAYPLTPLSALLLSWGKLPPLNLNRLAHGAGLSLSDSFVVRFQHRSTSNYEVLGIDNVTVRKKNFHYVNSFPFIDGFESGKLDSMWRWSNANFPTLTAPQSSVFPGGFVGVQSTNPFEGTHHASLGNFVVDFNTPIANALDLYLNLAHPMPLNVMLTFQIMDNSDETDPHDAVFLSNDGGERFVKIFQFEPSSWPNNIYREVRLNLTRKADSVGVALTETSIVRFQQYGKGSFNSNRDKNGFHIDDVLVDVKTAVADQERSVPTNFTLNQNYPNPFNPSTKISFALPSAQKVTLKIFDLTGKEVAALLDNERKPAGVHEMIFNAQQLSSGVYLYRLEAGKSVEAKKMLLVR